MAEGTGGNADTWDTCGQHAMVEDMRLHIMGSRHYCVAHQLPCSDYSDMLPARCTTCLQVVTHPHTSAYRLAGAGRLVAAAAHAGRPRWALGLGDAGNTVTAPACSATRSAARTGDLRVKEHRPDAQNLAHAHSALLAPTPRRCDVVPVLA